MLPHDGICISLVLTGIWQGLEELERGMRSVAPRKSLSIAFVPEEMPKKLPEGERALGACIPQRPGWFLGT